MDKTQNKYISVSYQLFSIDADGTRHIEEQTEQGDPFKFVSGFGFTLEGFEQRILPLEPGQKFDFTLSPAESFGDYNESNVQTVDREFFSINGHFDHEHIFPGATVPLKDNDGHYFMGTIKDVTIDDVTVDTNHPLAGCSLQFIGIVLENRDATNQEIQDMLNHMSCGCGCDDCDGECNHEGHSCGCGHCH